MTQDGHLPPADGSLSVAPSRDTLSASLTPPYPPRVLVVDDSDVSRQFMVICLATLGIPCDVAENGREAIQRAATTAYTLILMDVYMTELSGCDTARQIRARIAEAGQAFPQPRIIAVSAETIELGASTCYLAGMDGYLSKPFRIEELAAIVNLESPGSSPCPHVRQKGKGSVRRPILDRAIFASVEELERRTHTPLFGYLGAKLLHELEELLPRMDAALHEGDWPELQNLTHGIKGSANMMGATRLAACAKLLHATAGRGRKNRVPKLLALLRQEGASLENWMQTFLGNQRT